jgi:large subunit ribosomal protein L9
MKIVVHKRVGDHGNLFGSVTTNDIADALTKRGIEVDKRRIELAHPIKSIGTHDVEVRLHREVAAHIQVEVVPEGKESIEVAPVPAAAPAPAAEEAEA